MVAQIDKDQAAVVTLAMDPARQPHIGAGVAATELTTGVSAIGVHDLKSSSGGSKAGFREARKGA
jgi:hypothetical protein